MIQKVFLIILFTLTGCTFLHAQEKGMASYYSSRMHGRRMSDGTKYHRDSLTCAHKRYPLGTMLKVTNIKNNKSVVVKVTDRCGSRRIIDLSYAAAKQIGMISSGIAMVKVEKYTMPLNIPFKPTDEIDLPELDFEITEKHNDTKPIWMKTDDEKEASHEIRSLNRPARKQNNKHNSKQQ